MMMNERHQGGRIRPSADMVGIRIQERVRLIATNFLIACGCNHGQRHLHLMGRCWVAHPLCDRSAAQNTSQKSHQFVGAHEFLIHNPFYPLYRVKLY